MTMLHHQEQLKTLKFGDMIQFKPRASTRRQGDETVWRMVTGWRGIKPTVRFYGDRKLVIELTEILAIQT